MKSNKILLTKNELHKIFYYQDGYLYWNFSKGKIQKDIKAGSLNKKTKYLEITYKTIRYKAHRLIWVYHFGDFNQNLQIDHINGIRDDNRITNLRLVTPQQNQWNQKTAKGYYFDKNSQKYKAKICIGYKNISLGYYLTENEARQAYLDKKDKLHIFNEQIQ